MKVFIYRTSEFFEKRDRVEEFANLDECFKKLFDTEDFGGYEKEFVISKPNKYTDKMGKDCDYVIEIYDSWRE